MAGRLLDRGTGKSFANSQRGWLTCTDMDFEDPKDLVRRGYDALSLRYDQAYGSETKYQPWISELIGRIPAGGTVLDLGCGSGRMVLIHREMRTFGVDG